MAISFLAIGFLEIRVFFDSDFIALFGFLELHKFDVDLTDIAIVLEIIRIPSDCLFILFKALRILS